MSNLSRDRHYKRHNNQVASRESSASPKVWGGKIDHSRNISVYSAPGFHTEDSNCESVHGVTITYYCRHYKPLSMIGINLAANTIGNMLPFCKWNLFNKPGYRIVALIMDNYPIKIYQNGFPRL